MSQQQALAAARELQAAIQARGVKCVIDLRVGAGSAGWVNPKSRWAGVLAHHVVSRRSQGLTPFYALCRNGRGGALPVPGPLCNGYMGFDGVYRIITMGWANHPGQGGPITLAGKTIPRDNGRPYLWGTEFEGGLDPADWPEGFHDSMARAHAGILDWLGLPTTAHIEHKTWAPRRKVDRLGYDALTGQRRIDTIRAGSRPAPTEEDDDMGMTDEERALLEGVADGVTKLYDAVFADGLGVASADTTGQSLSRGFLAARLAGIREAITQTHNRVLEVPGNVWRHTLEHPVKAGADGKPMRVQAGDYLRWEALEHDVTRRAIAAAVGSVPGLSPEQAEAAIEAGMRSWLDGSDVTIALPEAAATTEGG